MSKRVTPETHEVPAGSWLVCGFLTQQQLDALPEEIYRQLSFFLPGAREWSEPGEYIWDDEEER
jgi:hypothetical protein